MKKEAIVFINKLIEIELNLSDNPSGEIIYSLKKQFNHILTKLKKPLIYEQNSPQDIIDILIEKFDYPEDFATSKNQNQIN